MSKNATATVTVTPSGSGSSVKYSAECTPEPVKAKKDDGGKKDTGVQWTMASHDYLFTGLKIKRNGEADSTYVTFNAANPNGSTGGDSIVEANFSGLVIDENSSGNNSKSRMTIADSLTNSGSDANPVKFDYCIEGEVRAAPNTAFEHDPQIYNED